jgi:hypothetical protein
MSIVITVRRLALLPLVLLALTACGSSPPVHYYALSSPSHPPASGAARMLVELLPVVVPERVNHERVVVGGAGDRLDLRDDDQWAAPLADEIRHVVAEALWQRLRAADVYQAPVASASDRRPQYRLALRIERFDALPGRSAVVEASWTARKVPQGPSSICRAGFAAPLVDATTAAAVAALSDATGRLAEAIADALARLDQGIADSCPQGSP